MIYELNEEQRHELEYYAATTTRAYDHPDTTLMQVEKWLDRVPALKALISSLKHNEDPILLIRGLPQDAKHNLGATPADGKRSKTKKTFISEAMLYYAAAALGMKPVAYHNEKLGEVVHQICPVEGWEKSMSNMGSEDEFPSHVEVPQDPNRPEVIGLYCLRGHPEAITYGIDMIEILSHFTEDEKMALCVPQFKIMLGESFGHDEFKAIPIISRDSGMRMVITVDLAEMEGINPYAVKLLEKMKDVLSTCKRVDVALEPGDMLLVHNLHALHGRTGFKPIYGEDARWLQRMYMTPEPWPKHEGRYWVKNLSRG